MHIRNSYFLNNSSVTILRRRNKRRAPNVVKPKLRTIVEVAPMTDNQTMKELLQAPTEGYGEAIIIPKVNAYHFEIKTNLLQLVQANPYHGFERENPHTHINIFKRITSTLKFKDVPNDVIKLMMFPYSLEGSARVWYDKEPPNSILTWDDLVNKFVNQFFPPSKTTHLKNEISQFTQRFEETFGEAWERFKEMLRACKRIENGAKTGILGLNPLYTIKECSSCGALYSTDYCCSNGSLVDKIIYDLNKAPDSPHLHTFSSNQRHCFQCKDVLGDGEFCQRCTCMRCGSGLSKGLCLICGNNQNSLNDSPSISENSSQSPPHINHHCCYECGDPLDGIFCKQCTCKSFRKGAHIGYNCPPTVPVISNPEPCKNQSIDELPQTLPSFHPTCYSGDESPFTYDSTPNIFDDSPNVFNPPPQPPKYSYEFCGNDAYYGHDCLPQDYTIAITPKEPDNFLSMRDKHLDTIQATESNEFIKSSVKNLVTNPSESEGEHKAACDDFTTFSNLLFDVEDDFPSSDDESFSDEDISKKIYSNLLFDEEIISIKIDPHAESDLIESLLNQDSLIISSSSKINSLLDEFAGKLILLKSIPPGIDKADYDPEEEIHLIEKLLYDNSSARPLEEFISKNSDAIIESFSPSPIHVEDSGPFMKEIDLFLASDGSIPLGIDSDYSDSEKDNLFLERLLHDDPIPFSNTLDFSNVV
uniref:Reverse transcriptase domain-containing protein n=1 Tax=Tanacetum cinerariifolium TaxID=118510 RepID=A0A6L2K6N9_TANCI|nr:reverse transcriptase domain-containing protein [Tanacetum cinerariifolium]